jgi:predicted enzyme related to lactoylglutathione lyase
MNPVVHFEMPYDDAARMQKFYQAAFGWKMQALGKEMGNYVVAKTGPTTADGWPTEIGRINGGFFARTGGPDQYPSVVISVDDLNAAMDVVKSAGGEVLGDPFDIPGVGAYVSIRDSEGNRVGMLEPLPMPKKAKAKPKAKKPVSAKKKAPAKKKQARR